MSKIDIELIELEKPNGMQKAFKKFNMVLDALKMQAQKSSLVTNKFVEQGRTAVVPVYRSS